MVGIPPTAGWLSTFESAQGQALSLRETSPQQDFFNTSWRRTLPIRLPFASVRCYHPTKIV